MDGILNDHQHTPTSQDLNLTLTLTFFWTSQNLNQAKKTSCFAVYDRLFRERFQVQANLRLP